MSLADRVAAPDYLDRIVNVSERIAGVTEQAAVQWLLNESIAALGAQSAVFVSFVRDKVEVSSCRFMLACDPAWCRQYLAAGLIAHDPWMAYAAHHSEPALASHLGITRSEQLQVMELASRNGFASAVLVPVHSLAPATRASASCAWALPSPATSKVPASGASKLARVHSLASCTTGGSLASATNSW